MDENPPLTSEKKRKAVNATLIFLFYASVVALLIEAGEYFTSGMSESEGLLSSIILFIIFGLAYGARVKEWPLFVKIGKNKIVGLTAITIIAASMIIGSFEEEWPMNIILIGLPLLVLTLALFLRLYRKHKNVMK